MSNASQVKQKLIEYFQAGEKEETVPFQIGMELEHFIVREGTKKAVSFYGDRGIQWILEQLSKWYPVRIYEENALVGLSGEECILTLEPSAQLEISIEPKNNLSEIEEVYKTFRGRLEQITKPCFYEVVTTGYHPGEKVDDLSLIPKKRYEFMDDYFGEIGHYGREMMRGTASTQVSIDYYNEKDFQRKYKIASVLAPVFMYVFSNCPVYEGEKSTCNLLRKRIWDGVDSKRVRNIVEEEFSVLSYERYAEFVMNVPLIVKKEENGTSYTKQLSGACYLGNEQWELEHMLSMVFPMVRLKQFIEIRYADALELSHAMCYIAWIKGLFQDVSGLEQVINGWKVKEAKDLDCAIENLLVYGDEAQIYGKNFTDIVCELYVMALDKLNMEEKKYLKKEYLSDKMKKLLGDCGISLG